jgi:hypothetical protein
LQTILLTQETIKTPALSGEEWPHAQAEVVDISDKFAWTTLTQASFDTISTRNALKSTSNTTPQPRLWQENIGCSSSNDSQTQRCVLHTTTLGNLSALSNPFLTQLPVGFNTGLIKQFIPRINSTVKWEPLPRADMPVACDKMPNSFYAHYANAPQKPDSRWGSRTAPRNWSI